MRGAALIIATSIMLSRILGMVREMLLAKIAGITAQKSALDLAFMIPDILNHLVSTGFLSMIFIPIFTGYMVENNHEKAWRFFSNILNVLGVFLLILVVPAWFFMEELLLLFSAADPTPQVLSLAVHYARILLPGQLAFFAGSFLIAVQHTRRQFLWPSLTGVVYNAAIIIGGWLGRHHGLEGFAWGVPVGAFVGFLLLQIWAVRRGGIHWSPVFDFKDPDVRRYIALMLPLMTGVGAMFALEFVIRSYGSVFGQSGISSLNYAYRLMYTLVAVFGFSVGVASYPDMARLAKENKQKELNQKLSLSLERMYAMLVPTALGVWFLSFPAVRILFERGAFNRESAELVATLLRWYLPAAFGLCAQAVVVRSYYARERMWTPTLVNSLLFVASLSFYSMAALYYGVNSVPMVGALTALLQVVALFWIWHKSYGAKGFETLGRSLWTNLLTLLILGPMLAMADCSMAKLWRDHSLIFVITVSACLFALIFVLSMGLQTLLGNQSAKQLTIERLQNIRKRLPL